MNVKVNVSTLPERRGNPRDWVEIRIGTELARNIFRQYGRLVETRAEELRVDDVYPDGWAFDVENTDLYSGAGVALVVRANGDFLWQGGRAANGMRWETDPISFTVLIQPEGTGDLDLREHREERADGERIGVTSGT